MKMLISSLTLVSLSLVGCAKGFQSLDSTALGTTNGSQSTNSDTSNPNPSPASPSWDKVDMDGIASGGAYSGQLVVFIDKQKQSILLVLPIPVLVPIFGSVEIPEAPGAYLTTYTDAKNNISMAVNVPLKYIIRGGQFTQNQRLPNGDPLPFVPAGELPGFGIQFPQMPAYQVYLYIGVNVAAAFVELPDVGLPIGAIFPVKNKTKTKVVGAIGYVTPKNNFDGGMYLAAQIPDDMARLIDDLIRY